MPYLQTPAEWENIEPIFPTYCDELLPLIIITTPSLIRRPSPGSRQEWVRERVGSLKQAGLAACDEAHLNRMEPHHRCCLNAERASSWETGLFPVHARWCPRGSRKGALRDFRDARNVSRWTRGPDKTAPVIRPSVQDAGVLSICPTLSDFATSH